MLRRFSSRAARFVRVSELEISYSYVIYELARRGVDDGAARFLQAMAEDQLQPNAFAYQAVLNGYAKKMNKWQKAVQLFSEMRKSEIKPTANSYAAVIDSCGKAGELRHAERWFNQISKESIRPNSVCYNVLISANARQGYADGALRWLQRMHNAMLFDIVAYNSALHSLCESQSRPRAQEEAEALLRDLRSYKLHPTAITLDLLEKLLGAARRDELCHELDVDMDRAQLIDRHHQRS
ncbi:unnamed protein product [Durusdinium trenchii]|uniref:Pentatricopeptide repeat-containing protein n=3 Tax=Durusdinium trenchii TaxID=1381693 RepID=A0ABP0Q9C7_9DINO